MSARPQSSATKNSGGWGRGVGSSDIGGGCWREIWNPTGIKHWLLSTAAWQKRKDPAERRSLFNYWRGWATGDMESSFRRPQRREAAICLTPPMTSLLGSLKDSTRCKLHSPLLTETSLKHHTYRTCSETYLVFICRPGWLKKGNSGVLDWAGQRKSGLNNRS